MRFAAPLPPPGNARRSASIAVSVICLGWTISV
jgi:hypothetical protein